MADKLDFIYDAYAMKLSEKLGCEYEKLQPFQTTALIQCKKFMTPAEKKTYKAAVQKAAEKNSGSQPE